MMRKKLDGRIVNMINNCVEIRHRSIFAILGSNAHEQVVNVYNLLSKAQIKSGSTVLWCYKSELNFNNNKKKRLKKLQRRIAGGVNVECENAFDLFIERSKIRFLYYKDVKKILGNTFGMLVLQDFEALTPNTLASTIEAVEGGGIICFLLNNITQLRQLYYISMDVHSRYRTPENVVSRFNERFILSLGDCNNSLIVDDSLNILPVFSQVTHINAIQKKSIDSLDKSELELKKMRETFSDTQPLGSLIELCKTVDQAKGMCSVFDIFSQSTTYNVISLTSSRGRGKSALLGLFAAGAISLDISNICVVAPGVENVITFFEFVCKGLKVLGYNEKSDYEIITTNVDNRKYVKHIRLSKKHKQNIQYFSPNEGMNIYNCELLICDEAACIPIPIVKKLIGPYLLIISSTIDGYEGTGRSLTLKLIKELKENKKACAKINEITLNESIRYGNNDPVERWLYKLLCLDQINLQKIDRTYITSTSECKLYCISRDTLFSYHSSAEQFLQILTSLLISSHHRNSPNDLQMMADAPNHNIFVLLPDLALINDSLPQILCVIQTCIEGELNNEVISQSLSRGQRGSGDLIPWKISQEFCESSFASLSGMRIVRIATHPDYVGMGYGSRAMKLLIEYYENPPIVEEKNCKEELMINNDKILTEVIEEGKKLEPLLIDLSKRKAEKLDYIGVSYGLTGKLLKFWKRLNFVPLYLRQSPNDLTGEFTNIMIKIMNNDHFKWCNDYYMDFRSRFISLLSYGFKILPSSICLSLITNPLFPIPNKILTIDEINYIFTPHDIKRLEKYAHNLVEYTFIIDLIPKISCLIFNNKLVLNLNVIQFIIILSIGLQHKSIKEIEDDIDLEAINIISNLNKIIRKTVDELNTIQQKNIMDESDMVCIDENNEKKRHVSNNSECKIKKI